MLGFRDEDFFGCTFDYPCSQTDMLSAFFKRKQLTESDVVVQSIKPPES